MKVRAVPRLWRLLGGAIGSLALFASMLTFAAIPVGYDTWPPVLLLAPILLLVVTVHEAGHLASAAAVGATILGVGVGPIWLWRRRRGIRLVWRAPVHGTSGIAFAVPSLQRDMAAQMLAFAAGGPAANLISAGLAIPYAWPRHEYPSQVWMATVLAFGIISLATGLINLLPVGRFHATDGSVIATWWRGGPELETSRRVLTIYGLSLRGVIASELLVEEIAALEADPQIGVRFFGRYIALRAAQQRGDFQRFEQIIESCREELATAEQPVYDSLRGLWAYFQLEQAFERACGGVPTEPEADDTLLRRIAPALRLRLGAANALAGNDIAAFARLSAAARVQADGEFDIATRRAEAMLLDRLDQSSRQA